MDSILRERLSARIWSSFCADHSLAGGGAGEKVVAVPRRNGDVLVQRHPPRGSRGSAGRIHARTAAGRDEEVARAAGGPVLVTTDIAKQGIRCFVRRSKDQAFGGPGVRAVYDGVKSDRRPLAPGLDHRF